MEALNQPPQSLDQKLKHLIQEALKHPVHSTERQQCLNDIYTLVMKSGKLWRDYNPYYGDAVNDMWYECFTHLEDYDPSLQQVTTWLNDSLRRALRRYRDRKHRDLKRHLTQVRGDDGQEAPIVEFLPGRSDAAEAQKHILYPVLKWVEADADGLLQKRIFLNRAEINAQTVILKRIPPQSKDWPAICAEFELSDKNAKALPKWYHRYCKPFLKNFGTQTGIL